MAEPQSEMRSTRRFSLRLPVSVKYQDTEVQELPAHTRDVSARGVYFYVDQDLEPGSPIEFTLTLPPEITLTDSIRVRCRGHIVRVHPSEEGGKLGVAAAIDHYDFVPER
jgi:hypothetical protein